MLNSIVNSSSGFTPAPAGKPRGIPLRPGQRELIPAHRKTFDQTSFGRTMLFAYLP